MFNIVRRSIQVLILAGLTAFAVAPVAAFNGNARCMDLTRPRSADASEHASQGGA